MLKSAMTSFSVRRFCTEARILPGSHFHKAYQIDYGTVVLRFAVPRTNLESYPELKQFLDGEPIVEEEGISLGIEKGNYVKVDLLFRLGQIAFLTGRVRSEMPKEAMGFAMLLRKALRNRVLERIEQVNMERLLVLHFAPGPEDSYRLVMELFGDGNLILVNGETIEAPYTSRTWSTRTVKRGEPFQMPPASIDPHDLDIDKLREIVLTGEGDLVRTLVKKASMPPVYSEEVCFRSGLDKNTALQALSTGDHVRIMDAITDVLKELEEGSGCYLYKVGREPTLLEPVLLRSVFGIDDERKIIQRYMHGKGEDKDLTLYPTISMAIEENIFDKGSPPTEKELAHLKAQDRVKRMHDSQATALAQRKEEAELSQSLAEAVYLEYSRIDTILRTFDPKLYLEDRKAYPDVRSFSAGDRGRKGFITILVETPRGKRELQLDLSLDVNKNAERLYDTAKKAKSKIPGIEKALEDAKDKLEDLAESPPAEKLSIPLRRFWFEDFRWCFSSEGILMIGGRDARSNERLVKKYLRESDRYAHADIKGAPSVIVRVEKEEAPTEPTLVEACHMSVLNSKAWTSKVGSESAFWVLPDQVSRTPESGEFLPKGSFMIRGKKNMHLKLPMEGGAGILYIEGVPKVMFGPISAVRANCKGQLYRIVPGRSDKNDVGKVLSRELGAELDQVLSVLPPGDIDMSRMEGV
jgi:predicted ribosome quality control (RQC) complex YloA/Tae2 family protein